MRYGNIIAVSNRLHAWPTEENEYLALHFVHERRKDREKQNRQPTLNRNMNDAIIGTLLAVTSIKLI